MPSQRQKGELAKLAHKHRVPLSVTDTAIYDFLSALDCPMSLAVWLLYKSGEHSQLVDMDIDPNHYLNDTLFRDAYAAWSFLSKSDFLKLDVSKDDRAFEKFFAFEELCASTNNRFRNLGLDPNYHGSNVWLLNATIQKISKILGDFSADEIVDSADWGPGVSTLLKGEHVSAINKFHSENGITRDLYALVGDWFPVAYPLWSEHLTARSSGDQCFNFQVGNSIVTVPKNSKTNRVIAVEPGINLWFQKGIGSMIRRRLLRWGIDLRDQERNANLAREASVNGLLATVDFSSASDSIAKELVRELVPHAWFQLLNSARCSLGKHKDKLIRWEKFSSMGNGYTFELESLIFFAAALAVKDYLAVDGEVSVYGDDVILPTKCFPLFSSFTAFLGFKVNKDKSFATGYFRESCGSHWFDGSDCKPIFLKERVTNAQAIYRLANSVRNLAHRRCSYYGCDARFLRCWRHLFARAPNPLRFGVSRQVGDVGFIVNFDEAHAAIARDGIEGYYTNALVEIGIANSTCESPAVLMARLREVKGSLRFHYSDAYRRSVYGRTDDEPSDQWYKNSYTLRGRTKLAVKRILVAQWYNLGPWI
jgi:hypothetical protein